METLSWPDLSDQHCVWNVYDENSSVICYNEWCSVPSFVIQLVPVPLTIFRSNSKFEQNWERSSLKYTKPITTKFAHVTTVTLSWRVQNFVVIGRVYFKPEHCKIWSNFEFDRNIVSGTVACCMIVLASSCFISRCLITTNLFISISIGSLPASTNMGHNMLSVWFTQMRLMICSS